MKLECEGIIGVKIGKADGSVRYESQFNNLITNSGLDAFGKKSIAASLANCRVGNGTTETKPNQSDLVSVFGDAATLIGRKYRNSGESPWWHNVISSYRFEAGSVSGSPLTEVAFFNSDSAMISRALFKDLDGNPVAINILDDEILFIDYSVRLYVPEEDFTGTLIINGVTHQLVGRAVNASGSRSWGVANGLSSFRRDMNFYESDELVPYDSSSYPSGDSDGSILTSIPYVAGSFSRHFSTSLGLPECNFATGIGSFRVFAQDGGARFQVSINPKIKKDDKSILTLNSFLTASWGRRGE